MKKLTVCLVLGLFLGAGPAMAYTWAEVGDAGDLPGSAQTPVGAGSLTSITGEISDGTDADMYRIHIYDPSLFFASTVGGAAFDTQLWLFDTAGNGVSFNDDSSPVLQSTLTGAFVSGVDDYYLAISAFDFDAVDASGDELWVDGPFTTERAPDGPGAANPIDHWSDGASEFEVYAISLRGVGDGVAPIPEPATFALFGLGLGAAGIGMARRRRNMK